MRKDVFIDNDSGGFSVIAVDAVDDMIADQRADDTKFVTGFKALLLELYGDDSMPVRFVIDEPLNTDEDEQWLARASWRIDTTDGRLMAMGGFDPDVLADWKDAGGVDDGRGVAVVEVPRGPLRVDVYAHVGSMNGRQILSAAPQKPGTAFRRSHPDRPFPLWLTRVIEFSGEDDPGFEQLWSDVPGSMAAGALAVDTASPAVIGFLVHVRPAYESPGTPPEGGWFARDDNARVPATFPMGLATDVHDPEIESQRNRLLGREDTPEPPRNVSETTAIIERWTGDPMRKIKDNTPPLAVNVGNAYWLYWIAGMTVESPPLFEYLIAPKGSWTAPEATPEYGVVPRGKMSALRPASDMRGWGLWHGARSAATALSALPDGSIVDIATAPRERDDQEVDDEIGRTLYEGVINNGTLEILEVSPPAIERATLAEALAFVGEMVTNQRIQVRAGEREVFDRNAAIWVPEEDRLIWEGDAVRLFEPDERELLLLAAPVFRARFGHQWKCEEEEDD